ncbi:acyl-CoA dehydrogenase family protein [Yinghuangia sp. YIM S09857]|uniref:acyl-CoA dehydrogenase family protein n=1 Tax=Yinghuangia sp. YIM S09857 TaxID=3436929 RepID=UPI003F53CAAD
MDFTEDPATGEFREEVRRVLAEHLTAELREHVGRTGTNHDWGLHRAVAERGWLAGALPVPLGGTGRSPEQLAALFRELELASAPYDGISNAMLVSYILGHTGTATQKETVMADLLTGRAIACLGYSEPGSGSDVAAAATRAIRATDGDGWVVNGQKMFTSLAEEARWALLLARTDTEAAKHRGLTFFLVDMTSPGVEVQELRTLSGKRTNITYYDDVRVPDAYRVGEVNGGWDVMLVALSFERGVAGGISDIAALHDLAVAKARTVRSISGEYLIDRPEVRERLARVAVDMEVAELLGARVAWAAGTDRLPAQEGAECKLFATEAYGRAADAIVDAFGSEGLRHDREIEHAYRVAPIFTTAGGTSEVLRNLIAERGLKLPRAR